MNDSAHWRCPFYRWDSPDTKRFCEAWKKKLWSQKALLHFHMVRDFLTSEILAGQMFTLELMDVALKWHPPPLCEVHRCPVATDDTRKRLQVVTGTANKCSDWPCLCLYDVALIETKQKTTWLAWLKRLENSFINLTAHAIMLRGYRCYEARCEIILGTVPNGAGCSKHLSLLPFCGFWSCSPWKMIPLSLVFFVHTVCYN